MKLAIWNRIKILVIHTVYFVITIYATILCGIAEALSALTNTPSNVIIERGDDVHMQCSTDAPNNLNTITWQYDGATVVAIPCTAVDISRFNISSTSHNVCNIIGHSNPIDGNQGPYHCSDGSGKTAEAIAILIGTYQRSSLRGCAEWVRRSRTCLVLTPVEGL